MGQSKYICGQNLAMSVWDLYGTFLGKYNLEWVPPSGKNYNRDDKQLFNMLFYSLWF